MITSELLDDILLEWSYRLKDGIPDVNDPEKVKVLNDVLTEYKLPLYENLLLESDTEDTSEMLCMYFCCLDNASMKAVLEHISSGKLKEPPVKKLKMISGLTSTNLGTSGDTKLQNLLDLYNQGKPDVKLFSNAYTCAQLIRSNYSSGNPISPSSIDRGNTFTAIKTLAVGLLNDLNIVLNPKEADKWTPADIFIYNNGFKIPTEDSVENSILELQSDQCLNSKFTSTISNESGKLVGISLKQQLAQGGKALSFKKTLEKGTDYVNPDSIPTEDKGRMEFMYNVNVYKTGIEYLAEATRISKISGFKSNSKIDVLLLEIKNSIDLTLEPVNSDEIRKFLSSKEKVSRSVQHTKESLYSNKELLRTAMKTFKLSSKYSNGLISAIESTNDSLNKPAFSLYTTSRDKFYDICKKRKYDIKSPEIKSLNDFKSAYTKKTDTGKDMDPYATSQTLYKKANCYTVATWFLEGLGTDQLVIPPGYITIADEHDAFVALVAYAIGFSGISPPFIKVVGSNKITGSAHLYNMGGSEISLKLQKNTVIKVLDSPQKQGFQCLMELEAGDGKYSATLDFRYAGDQVNIEVSKIS